MARTVDDALKIINRAEFMPEDVKPLAKRDRAAAIGYGQTISQPTTVKRMLRWLDVRPGQKVLDVGSGSGWTTALLAYLVGPEGFVHAVELVPELVKFGRANFKKTKLTNARFHQATAVYGWPEEAPFERILVSASADKVPPELVDQLAGGGKMVIPVGYDILEISKSAKGTLDKKVHPGYVFVPLLPQS